MNGAEHLVETLADQGVEVCFANPGTSEMHFLAALENPRIRSVLCLFEGIATGAADGWARMPVTTIVFANNTYNILKMEFSAMRAGDSPGPAALSMIDIDRPTIDWCAMAKSMGVPAVKVETAEDFTAALIRSCAAEGPMLIEVKLY